MDRNDVESTSDLVAIGKVNKPVGLRGEISAGLFRGAPVEISADLSLYIKGVRVKVDNVRIGSKGKIILKLDGVVSREEAEPLRGEILEVNKYDIPTKSDGTLYHYQLMGMKVIDLDGVYMGVITEIIETGANDVYVITNQEDSTTILAPAIAQTVHSSDEIRGVITVDPQGCIKQPVGKEKKKEK